MKHRLRNTSWILWILAILIAPSACSSCIPAPSFNFTGTPSSSEHSSSPPPVTKDFTGRIPDWPNEHCPTISSFSTIGIQAVSETGGGESFTVNINNGAPNCTATIDLSISRTLRTIPTTLRDTVSHGSLQVTSLARPSTAGQADYPGEPHTYYGAQATWDPPIPAGLYVGGLIKGGALYQATWIILPATGNEPQVQREAIRNESTGELLVAPSITIADIALRQVIVPNLGTFTLKIIPLQAQKTIPPK